MAYLEELTLNTAKFQIPEYKAGENVSISADKTISVDLSAVAKSGDYADLINKPSIPTKTSDLTNDSGFITSAPVTSVNGRTGAVTGLQEALEEVTVSTSGAVTQTLESGKVYHFTSDSITSLTVSAESPTVGRYEFDFISGATAPTVTMPSSWVMPNNFIIEPNGKYRLVIDNGYCVANRWANNHSPFTYVDVESGAFVVNTSAVTATNIYANIGTEIVSINLWGVKNKNELANNKYLKICTISADTKALIGETYVIGNMPAGTTGKMVEVIFNTWQTGTEIQIHNITGGALPANTVFAGMMFVLRTL